MMKAEQVHYTSCRRGQTGSSGFQVRSASPGIAPEDVREIERRGLYRPPLDVDQQPSDEEIERDLPRAFRFGALGSGRHALTMSCYSGRDYSGRWGNFYAHSLVLPAQADGRLWPIDYYEWSGWKTRLEADEDTDEVPTELSRADLTGFQPAGLLSLQELASFINSKAGREELLVKAVRAAVLAPSASRAVVIRDSPINGLYWVACVTKLFPVSLAAEISFSTYQYDPRGCARINATTGETEFRFDDAERSFRFFELDISRGVHSEIEDRRPDYATLMVKLLLEGPSAVEAFFDLASLLEGIGDEADELDALADLYRLQTARNAQLDHARLIRLISFVTKRANAEGRRVAIEALGRVLDQTQGLEDPDELGIVIRFIAETPPESQEARLCAVAVRYWQVLLKEHVLARGEGVSQAWQGWQLLKRMLAGELAGLADAVLGPDLWPVLVSDARGASAEVALLLIGIVRDVLGYAGQKPAFEDPRAQELVAATLADRDEPESRYDELLEAVSDDPEELGALVRTILKIESSATPTSSDQAQDLGKALGPLLHRLAEKGSATPLRVRGVLNQEATWDVLVGEWSWMVASYRDPRRAYELYTQRVAADLVGYLEARRSEIAHLLLDRLVEDQAVEQVVHWEQARTIDRFSAALRYRCVGLINDAISFDLKDQRGTALSVLLRDSTKRLDIELVPDRAELRRLISTVVTGRARLGCELERATPSISALDDESYRSFLRRFLVQALLRAATQAEHARVLDVVLRDGRQRELRSELLRFFKAQRKGKLDHGLESALLFWLRLDPSDRRAERLECLQGVAWKGLELALASLGERQLARLDERVRKQSGRDSGQVDAWERLAASVRLRKQGLWARLRHRLGLGGQTGIEEPVLRKGEARHGK